MPFEIVRNDLVRMQVDAIVNAASRYPIVGYGVDSAVHALAGPELLQERKQIGMIPVGGAEITGAYGIPHVRYVIHAVSPLWQGGDKGELEQLRSCYERSLELAREKNCASIAFPLLSAGNHGFPKDRALQTAIGVISRFLMEHEMQVYLVVFGEESFALSAKLFRSVQSYIDNKYIQERTLQEYGVSNKRDVRDEELRLLRRTMMEAQATLEDMLEQAPVVKLAPSAPMSLEEMLQAEELTFSRKLLALIDEKGLSDPQVYKRANIDRKLFSKIRSNPQYKPSKGTAISLAIALQLDYEDTLDLIGRAGYTLSHANKSDIIVEYFLMKGNYDIFELNEVLFAFEQPPLGA